jgi:OmpA-OmpF porin, OOP family
MSGTGEHRLLAEVHMLWRSWIPKVIALSVLTTVAAGSVTPAEAQFGKRLKERLKKNVEDKAIDKAVEGENKAIDDATSGKKADSTAAPTAAAPAPAPAANGAASSEAASEPAGTAVLSTSPSPADQKVWANYDFVPGQRTIFYTDFTEDQVGNFPERLDFKTGQMEVVEFEGGKRGLKASTESQFVIPLPEVLPEKYTIEVDVINRNSQGTAANTIELAGGSEGFKDDKGIHVGWGHNGLETRGGGMENQWIGSKDEDKAKYVGHPASFRLLGDGKYLKIYADEKRLANFPKATLTRAKAVSVRLQGRDDDKEAVYITRIRVAESEKSIYDALSSKGRWSTQGILFDTGKSEIKPESTPTLKQIAAALKEHPDLKVEVQGHTDNVGKAEANMKLSQARADAVKRALTGEYGVTDAQITAKGYGDTKPAAANTTPEGRANNRRVELVKS